MTLMPGSAVKYVNVGKSEVRYRDGGLGKRPVVLLHGTGGSIDAHYQRTAAMLTARHRVIAIEFTTPACGETLELEDLVDQLAAVMADTRISGPEITLVGYSLGAVVAAAYASSRPEVLKSLVLIAGWVTSDKHQLLRNSLARQLQAENPEAYAKFAVLCAYSPGFIAQRTEEELDALIRLRATVSEAWGEQMELNARIDLSTRVGAITVPTLVVTGQQDLMAPEHQGLLLFGAIESARLAVLPTGHAIAGERPAQLFRLIDQFASERMTLGPGEIYVPDKI